MIPSDDCNVKLGDGWRDNYSLVDFDRYRTTNAAAINVNVGVLSVGTGNMIFY